MAHFKKLKGDIHICKLCKGATEVSELYHLLPKSGKAMLLKFMKFLSWAYWNEHHNFDY